MTGQRPFTIAQLLIQCTPVLRTASIDEAMTMAPLIFLHLHTCTHAPARLLGINRIPSPFSGISPHAPPAPFVPGPPVPA